MGESLTQQRRVIDEAFRSVKICREGRITWMQIVFKSAVKTWSLTPSWQWKLLGLSVVGAEGIPGVAVKCVDIGKNTSGEGALLGHH